MSDLISREALLQDIHETVVVSSGPGSAEARGVCKVLDRIEAAPAVDAVYVVHGRWERAHIIGEQLFGYDPFEVDVFACSVCGAHFDVSEALNYCPNCGAKMDGGSE